MWVIDRRISLCKYINDVQSTSPKSISIKVLGIDYQRFQKWEKGRWIKEKSEGGWAVFIPVRTSFSM